MSNLVRELIAFDILKQELEDIEVDTESDDSLLKAHLQLIKQCSGASQRIITATQGLSEYDFQKSISNVEFVYKVHTKQLLTVHNRLIAWVIDFFIAKEKASKITDLDFSDQAEVRLDLWQTKSAKAKNQIKILANALGKEEYNEFIAQYRLAHTELAL
ncbi:hypothetical protein ACOI22_08820 [Glaciecola sp. 2405UD65-10]|uniref:hypothetical protein n=1 Tax=Glaciecola sp. 2405UD65-10 TaxID=3397244 RepID=UPI003B5BFAEA